MTAQANKSLLRRILVPGVSALVAATLIGCFGSDSDDNKKDDSLYVNREILRDTGAVVFTDNCTGCHGPAGEGGHGPRLANSSFVQNNRERLISVLIRGNQDTLFVNGQCYSGGGMSPGGGNNDLAANNFHIASVLSYIRMVLNDSIPSNCNIDGECTMTARDSTVMALDSIAVWEVKAVRDTLKEYPEGYVTDTSCPDL